MTISKLNSHLEPTAAAEGPYARISFRQPIANSGAIDAAWWPRSANLVTEVTELVEALWTAGRVITRITYNLSAWDAAPRRLQVSGRTLRLGGFATSDPLTIRLTESSARERIDVLVVPATTDPEVAERALRIAADPDNALSAAEILSAARDVGTLPAGMQP